MKNFIYAQVEPKLTQTVPEANNTLISNNIFKRFPQIKEFGRFEFQDVTLKSLDMHYNEGIEICYIHKGKHKWQIEDKQYLLYPGDCFITYPWQKHGSTSGFVDIGQISWIILRPDKFTPDGFLYLGNWSHLSRKKQNQIGKFLIKSNKQHFANNKIGLLFDRMIKELEESDFGFENVINHLIDELFIQVIRSVLVNECGHKSDEGACLGNLEIQITNDLAHKWTLEEMANIMGVCQTTLNHITKRETGYSPGQYLIDLRINAAKQMLENSTDNITEIAFKCGFSSSQHFSASFKQKTGYSPKEVRKKM